LYNNSVQQTASDASAGRGATPVGEQLEEDAELAIEVVA
jgi:hypothetical protein